MAGGVGHPDGRDHIVQYYCVRYLGGLLAAHPDRDVAISQALDQLRPAISPLSLSGLTSEEKALKALQIYEKTWTPSEAWYALVGEETPDEFLEWIMRAYDETYYSVEEAIEDYVYRIDNIEDAIRDIAVELLLQYVREHGCEERWTVDVDELIARCNAPTVEETFSRLENLSFYETKLLFAEYRNHRDERFGPNLLQAISSGDFTGF